ncbi:hypothetical protein ACT3SY_12125 [Brachybacterium sp. AOP42-E1-35]|uniref:hypothetical protein n=1 Tax=Brachybacterium sp. AOP42-E1-35 TaxID=3457664 RepID=UPI00402A81D8
MSTDPRDSAAPTGHSPSDEPITATHPESPPQQSPAVARPRHGSGLVARILTIVYALVVAPIATGLLAHGGSTLVRFAMSRGYVDASLGELLAGPAGARVFLGAGLGILLLASIVATGVVSSAGLLAVGVLGLLSVAISAVPELAFQIYQHRPPMVPQEALDGIVYGLPLLLHPLIGGLGLALVIARRRPDPHLVVSLLGVIVVPLGLLLASLMLLRGHADGVRMAMVSFYTETQLTTVVLVVLGALLLGIAAAASRWSPYALVIPAIVLLLVSAGIYFSAVELIPPAVWSDPAGQAGMQFLFIGGGFAVAVVMLVHTAVLAIVRARSRHRQRISALAAPTTAAPAGPASTADAAGASGTTGTAGTAG